MQTPTRTSGSLRIATGTLLMLVPLWAGFVHRSAWIIAPLAVAFAVSFMIGRWRPWAKAIREGRWGEMIRAVPGTLLVQAALISVLYLIGLGLGAASGEARAAAPFGDLDLIVACVAGAVGALAGLVISQLERTVPPPVNTSEGHASKDYEIRITDAVVTPETLLQGIHYSHGTYNKPQRGMFDGTPNEKSAGRTEDQITEAEGRLGRALPEGLIAIYKVQNGGSVGNACIPLKPEAEVRAYEDILSPFSGYGDLYPIEMIRTVWEAVTDYADPDDPEEEDNFPEGCRQMLVLAQWYRETLFLDYNQPGPPRVGFTDFDQAPPDGWKTICRWWPDFETFFAQLRVYEDVD